VLILSEEDLYTGPETRDKEWATVTGGLLDAVDLKQA